MSDDHLSSDSKTLNDIKNDPSLDEKAFIAEWEQGKQEWTEAYSNFTRALAKALKDDDRRMSMILVGDLHTFSVPIMRELTKCMDVCDENTVALMQMWLVTMNVEENFSSLAKSESKQLGDDSVYSSAYKTALRDAVEKRLEFRAQLSIWIKAHGIKLPLPSGPPTELQERLKQLTKQKPLAPHTNQLTDLKFPGDVINLAFVTSLSQGEKWLTGKDEYFTTSKNKGKSDRVTTTIRFPAKETWEKESWKFLCKNGASMVKAHYALWARYYEESGGDRLEWVTVNLNDFCRDMGYKQHHKGGYKKEIKQAAKRLLEALVTAKLQVAYNVPGKKKGSITQRRLSGTIWTCGLIADERDLSESEAAAEDHNTYDDLFGHAREGDPDDWVPRSFSFQPGAWFADEIWRKRNRFVGKIGVGLMQLHAKHDEWAILIGGYLGAIARMNKYAPRRIKAKTMLENTGLIRPYMKNRTGEPREKLRRALDRLVENNVIRGWTIDGFNDEDVDLEDYEALAAYGASDPEPEGNWMEQIYEITYMFSDDSMRITDATETAIKKKTQRNVKNKVPPPNA